MDDAQRVQELAGYLSDATTGARLGMTEYRVREIRRANGIDKPRHPGKWPIELDKLARDMHAKGAPDRQISLAIGKTRLAVIGWRHRRGLPCNEVSEGSRQKSSAACSSKLSRPEPRNTPSARLIGCEAWLPARHKAPPRDVDAMDLTAPHRYAAPNMERPLRPLEREAKRFFARTGWKHIGNGRWRRGEPSPVFAASGWLS